MFHEWVKNKVTLRWYFSNCLKAVPRHAIRCWQNRCHVCAARRWQLASHRWLLKSIVSHML